MQERLSRDTELEWAGAAPDADGARALVTATQPDLIVLDIMLGSANPLDLAEDLMELSNRSSVVVCTAWSDNVRLDRGDEFRNKVRASRIGVIAWISKGRGINEVIEGLRHAARWRAHPDGPSPLERQLGEYLQATGSAYAEDPFRVGDGEAKLTPMEARVAAMVATGLEANLTIEQIARNTSIALGTLRGHIKSVYAKFGVSGQAAFVAEARRRKLIDG
jgi:DNA-binding NarL/FixJ family response regulator